MELIDRVFYQLSSDGALVAITADYPGLLPASQVIEIIVPTFLKRIRLYTFHLPYTNGVL